MPGSCITYIQSICVNNCRERDISECIIIGILFGAMPLLEAEYGETSRGARCKVSCCVSLSWVDCTGVSSARILRDPGLQSCRERK